MIMFSPPKKIALLIFTIAFLVRVSILGFFGNENSLLYVNDSLTYLQVAKNIITHGVYSMEISEIPRPDNFRTPLYPLFLIPFVWSSASLYFVAIIQDIIASLGLVLFYFLGKKIFGQKIAFITVILGAIEPFSALINNQILTEAIFTPLFLGGLFLLTLFIADKNPKKIYGAAILLGLSALARPISSPLLIMLPVAGFFVYFKTKNFPFKQVAISIALALFVVSPWLLFAWQKVGTLSFSSINGMQLYAYHGIMFDNWRYQKNPTITDRLPEVDLEPINKNFVAAAIPPVRAVGLHYIKTHWPEYIWFHIIRTPRIYTDSGYANLLNGLSFLHFNYDSSTNGLLEELLYGKPKQALTALRNEPLAIVLLIADIFFLLVAIFALFNPLFHWFFKKQLPLPQIFLVLCIVLYTLVSSPIGGARFRIPINPLLFMLSSESIWLLLKIHQSRTIKNKVV